MEKHVIRVAFGAGWKGEKEDGKLPQLTFVALELHPELCLRVHVCVFPYSKEKGINGNLVFHAEGGKWSRVCVCAVAINLSHTSSGRIPPGDGEIGTRLRRR